MSDNVNHAASEKPFSFDSLDDVHNDIQDAAPEPNENAINAFLEEEQTEQTTDAVATPESTLTASDTFESAGTKFDPALHATDK